MRGLAALMMICFPPPPEDDDGAVVLSLMLLVFMSAAECFDQIEYAARGYVTRHYAWCCCCRTRRYADVVVSAALGMGMPCHMR